MKVFPDVTASTNFASLGYEADVTGIGVNDLEANGFSVRYDAGQQAYLIDLPSSSEGAFDATGQSASFWTGRIQGTGHYTNVFKPTPTNPEIALTYTSFAESAEVTCPFGCYASTNLSFVAFGSATPGSGVPIAGSASFDAFVAGKTLDDWSPVTGDATLNFDFGAGTLTGHFDPVLFPNNGGGPLPLGQYSFVNTVYGIGSTSFSGGLQRTGAPSLGSFNGLFTGPAAQELMARWAAPYLNPSTQQWNGMFGVWVGRKNGGP